MLGGNELMLGERTRVYAWGNTSLMRGGTRIDGGKRVYAWGKTTN